MGEEKKTVKSSKTQDDVQKQKEKVELKGDITQYFAEKGKHTRGEKGKIEDTIEGSKAEAEVKELLYNVSMKDVPLPEKIQPMFNSIFLTARRNKVKTADGLMLATSLLDGQMEIDYQEEQVVMAHGPQVQQAWRGSKVVLNFESMRVQLSDNMAQRVKKESEIKIPIITINGTDYLNVSERNLKYIAEVDETYKPKGEEACK